MGLAAELREPIRASNLSVLIAMFATSFNGNAELSSDVKMIRDSSGCHRPKDTAVNTL